MKKLFAVAIALAMLLSSMALAEAADFVGIWYLNELEMEGTLISPATMGIEMTFELKDDGTVTATSSQGGEDEVQEGTWAVEGEDVVVTLEDQPSTFVLEDGNLVNDSDGLKMILGREKAEGEAYVAAEPKADAAEADYAGSWKVYKLFSEGVYLDAALLGFDDLTAAIEGTTLTLNGLFFENEVIETSLADGALTFVADDPDAALIGGVTAQLLQDDALSLTLTIGDDMTFIMTRADAE